MSTKKLNCRVFIELLPKTSTYNVDMNRSCDSKSDKKEQFNSLDQFVLLYKFINSDAQLGVIDRFEVTFINLTLCQDVRFL